MWTVREFLHDLVCVCLTLLFVWAWLTTFAHEDAVYDPGQMLLEIVQAR